MKTKVLFLALLFISFASVSFAQRLSAKTKYQIARIEETLTSQLLNNADAGAASQAYLPSAQTMQVQSGTLVTKNAAEPTLASAKTTDFQQPGRIAYIDLQGTAAVARVERESSNGHVVDFVSLLQIDGEWKVVNQVRSYAESPALTLK
ncbi:nuclear transport factor 2 family protein [Hymenobacter sp. GOD-10R]|uniref:nuclear transport factor 2 family protein n=1 Tax=Hymenobacter sp. GOD-10R TaxID=3093922 RepID=UPI002D78156D|nr:nuclear transport factor 2 family protein [Hymenobacter sp. GOD-10R]WRQ30760.1 nuclear transport factor 2 family protein [Hymenobacter sp. GOD-10R]